MRSFAFTNEDVHNIAACSEYDRQCLQISNTSQACSQSNGHKSPPSHETCRRGAIASVFFHYSNRLCACSIGDVPGWFWVCLVIHSGSMLLIAVPDKFRVAVTDEAGAGMLCLYLARMLSVTAGLRCLMFIGVH